MWDRTCVGALNKAKSQTVIVNKFVRPLGNSPELGLPLPHTKDGAIVIHLENVEKCDRVQGQGSARRAGHIE